MSSLPPDAHKKLGAIFEKAGIEGDPSQAPSLGHMAMIAKSLQNSGSPTNEAAAAELVDFITSVVAPE